MQILPDDYNVKIITIYSAAGHGKGLIDDMSSFVEFSISDLGMTKEWFTQILIRRLLTKGGPKNRRKRLKVACWDTCWSASQIERK